MSAPEHDYHEVPPRVEDALTPLGYSLADAIAVLDDWGHPALRRVRRANPDASMNNEVLGRGGPLSFRKGGALRMRARRGYRSGMKLRLVRRVLLLLQAGVLAVAVSGTQVRALEAQSSAHAGHHGRHGNIEPQRGVASGDPATELTSMVSVIRAVPRSSGPDCCGDCPFPACPATAACGGSYLAAVPDSPDACWMAISRATSESRAPPPGSLVRTPLTPPPQIVG